MDNMDDIYASFPEGLVNAVRTHGFSKVASALYEKDLSNTKVALEHMGTRLFQRSAQNRAMLNGLVELAALSRD